MCTLKQNLLARFGIDGVDAAVASVVERYGGRVGDSYALALNAVRNPEMSQASTAGPPSR